MTSAPLRSSLGWSTPSEICVYGHDLPGELLGTIDFGGMTFLAFTGAMPTRPQARMFNAPPARDRPPQAQADRPAHPRLFDIARETGQFGAACETMHAIQAIAVARKGRALPINATGAIAAIAVDLGLTPLQAQRLGIVARSAGLVAHVMEEMREPIAREIWERTDDEVTQDQLARRAAANGSERKERAES
jgi:hypothetical protein